VLKARNGESFVELTPEVEDIAAIAAALQAALSPSSLTNGAGAAGSSPTAGAWRTQARLEGLRTL